MVPNDILPCQVESIGGGLFEFGLVSGSDNHQVNLPRDDLRSEERL